MKTIILVGVGFDTKRINGQWVSKKIKVKIPHIDGMFSKGTIKPNQEITVTTLLKQNNRILNACINNMDKKAMLGLLKCLNNSCSRVAEQIIANVNQKLINK